MSTITKRSVRRAGTRFKGLPTFGGMIAEAQKYKMNFATRGKFIRTYIADIITRFGHTQVVTVRHPTKRATRGRMSSLTIFLPR